MRVFSESHIPPIPIATERAMRPEAASAGLAPMPIRPCTTTAKALEKPMEATSTPVPTACSESPDPFRAAVVLRCARRGASWCERGSRARRR